MIVNGMWWPRVFMEEQSSGEGSESGGGGGGNLETMLSQGIPGEAPGSPEFKESDKKEQPSLDSGKETSPAGGQAGKDQDPNKEKQDPSQEQGSAEASKVPDKEALKEFLSSSEDPGDRVERLERDYRASSKEAKRLNEERKQKNEVLKAQGLKWEKDMDGNMQLIRTGKPKEGDLPEAFEQLSRKDQRSLEDMLECEDVDAEAVFNFIASKASRKPAPVPTAESVVHAISDERKDEAFAAVAKRVDLHPNVNDVRDLIEDQLDTAPKEVKAAFHANPEYVIALFDTRIQAASAALERKAQAATNLKKEKEEEAASAADKGNTGGGHPAIGTGRSDVEKNVAKQIAGADSF